MPILDPNSLEIISRSPEQTRRVGMRLGSLLKTGDVICLSGDLGSGKTTLVQGIASGWGSSDPTSSPTFVLINVYRRPGGLRLFHMDAYRMNSPAEAEDLDLDSIFNTGPLVVEWAERIRSVLPEDCLWVGLKWSDDKQRDMRVSAHGEHYQELLTNLRKHLYGG